MRLVCLVYRAHHPRWVFMPDSGEGAARYGGRLNPIGMPALYTSLRLETAWLEAQQGFPFKAQPMTMCAYEVDCADFLDLRDSAALTALGITPDQLGCVGGHGRQGAEAAELGHRRAVIRSRARRGPGPELRARRDGGGRERRLLAVVG